MGHSTREVGNNVGHLFGAGPVCLLTPHSATPPLQWCCRLGLSVQHQWTASAGDGQVGQRFGQSSWCSLPHCLSGLLALWSRRYGPTLLSLGGRMDALQKCPLSTLTTSHPQNGGGWGSMCKCSKWLAPVR